MNQDLATLRGMDLRERLVASRLAVRDAFASNPSIALREAIAEHDRAVSSAMRTAIAAYESLAAANPVPAPPVRPDRDERGAARSAPREGLPPPRGVASARPVPPA